MEGAGWERRREERGKEESQKGRKLGRKKEEVRQGSLGNEGRG